MLLLGYHPNPVLVSSSLIFDASSEVHLRSSLQSLPDGIKVPSFNHNVHHRGLWTEAAYGSLKPPPTRRLRRTYLHLSYSMTIARLHDTSMVKISSLGSRDGCLKAFRAQLFYDEPATCTTSSIGH